MAVIKSGTSSTLADVDATSKAMRVSIYGTDGTPGVTLSGSVEVSNDSGAAIPVSDGGSTLSVDDGGGSITVDGTVGVSGTVPVSGPLTDTQLRATAVPVSGTVTATGPLTDTQLRASSVPVSDGGGSLTVDGTVAVSNFPSTQAVSGTVSVGNFPSSQVVADGGASLSVDDNGGSLTVDGAVNADLRAAGAAVTASNPVPVSATAGANSDSNPIYIAERSATVAVTGTAAAAAGVTITLPAVAGQFHYITYIEITVFASAARTAAATPAVVTSTNLPGSLAWSVSGIAGAVGQVVDRLTITPPAPLRSSTVNTNTTIVCPATAGTIWRATVYYYTAP